MAGNSLRIIFSREDGPSAPDRAGTAPATPSAATADRRSLSGLDWLNFFVADVQTGFGPFIAVYLTAREWTETEIGFVLSVGTLTMLASQVPAGALVDAMARKRRAAQLAVAAITASALLFLFTPAWGPVALAEILHGFASCMMVPALAALSLRLAGREALGARLGRNARFAAIGNALAAGVMGALGTYVSVRSVFALTAALGAPALLALEAIDEPAAPPRPALHGPARRAAWRAGAREVLHLLSDRRLLAFAACVLLFHLSNAAMLPLAATAITREVGGWASLVISACILLPQGIVALISPWAGRHAQLWGRRKVLLLGFAALPLRGVLLAVAHDPALVVLAQLLDGVSGAVFGVMLPLVAADITRGTNRLNLCIGLLGIAVGAGATLSTAMAGAVAEAFHRPAAFLVLAAAGLLSLGAVLAMPETRPAPR